jgi:copper(I)-binding protein
MRSPIGALVFVAVLALVVVACSTSSGTAPTIRDAWVRAAPSIDRPTAAYLVITNPGSEADALVGASSPVAASAEVHETSMDASGMTGMHAVDRLEVPAGGTVRLEPGGYHLMLMELTRPLTVGEAVRIDLVFERAGTIEVTATVREG